MTAEYNRRRDWRQMRTLNRTRLAMVVGAVGLAVASTASATPNFSTSEIRAEPASPVETDVITYTVVVRNSGPDAAEAMSATAYWPIAAFLVDTTGAANATFDYAVRAMTLTFPLPAGGERRFSLRVLAPRRSAGDELTVEVRAADPASRVEYRLRETTVVKARPSTSGLRLGPIRIPTAALTLLGATTGGVLLWRAVRSRASRAPRHRRRHRRLTATISGPGIASAAVAIAVGFWALFGSMAWRDYQSLHNWPQTTCRILGGRHTVFEVPPRVNSAAPARTDAGFVPVLGLEYPANGQRAYSSGFQTGSRLEFGTLGDQAVEMKGWSVGTHIACWYNPRDPVDVVVRTGYGGVYLFALLPLPLFLIGATRIRSIVTGRG